jgi:CheY-like chemotaxis protein
MSIKILLADDSITIQKVVGIIFGGEDYTLTVVDNGKAAVEKAREINPDVLLIDALMPGMSGYEVCEAVRATPELAAKPILLLTGSFEPFDENKAKSCGADDFLAKPFESQQIVNKVKELFDLGSSRSGSPAAATASEPDVPAFADFGNEPAATPPVEEPAANDIWGAFTTPEETTLAAVEDDAFDVMGDETVVFDDAEEPPPAQPANVGTGSQWVPVEEEAFEFEEDTTDEAPVAPVVSEETQIDDSAFEMEITSPVSLPPAVAAEPEFEIPAPLAITPAAMAAAPATLTEDQLRAALAGASKEIIERIVWEVVPDLAETMIKEAIRKIKEGM